MTSLTPYERETVYTENDGEEVLHIFTHQARRITMLKKNPNTRVIAEGRYGTTKWLECEIPTWTISFRSKKRGASDAQRQAASENVAKARAARQK